MMKISNVNNVYVKDEERIDDLHRNGYLIIQNPKYFCFGADAVLLSNFAKVKQGENVIDLCTGTGIVPILLEAKTEGSCFIGIDIQEDCVEMAKRSVKLNGLEGKIDIKTLDVKCAADFFKNSYFDVVTANPPYMNEGGGIINNYSPKAIARHEILLSLEDVVSAASKLLKFGGRFYKLEPKTIRFVHPYADKEPNMVLIEGIRSAKPMLKILSPLIIYSKEGSYTDEIYNIYYG